ncbi:MAG TPA: response regulator [Verrucomicrobiae bacterium]
MTTTDLVLVAEDNPDDAILLRRAIDKAGITARVKIVNDGEEMLLYLQGRGVYTNRDAYPLPNLIILDLKMPRKSGLEVLLWMSENQDLAVVPTIVLSASNLEKDVRQAYNLGANTYFVKPTTFEELVSTMRMVKEYWHRAVRVGPVSMSQAAVASDGP